MKSSSTTDAADEGFDKVTYWKSRIEAIMLSKFKQLHADLEELEYRAKHINLDMKDIAEEMRGITLAFKRLDKAFKDAKVMKEKK